MNKNIILVFVLAMFFNACVSSNLFRFGELDKDVANKDKIINNFDGTILNLKVDTNVETLSVVLPKDDMTVRIKIKVANIEDVLYMNLVDKSDFNVNKLLKRVSSLDELDINQDGWVFEPSVEKGVITLQLYLPSIYLYTTQYKPTLLFSYKRNSRALQESLQFNFIKQNYYSSHDEDGHEIAQYSDLTKYCEDTGDTPSEAFTEQIDMLNSNRVGQDLKDKLQGICE